MPTAQGAGGAARVDSAQEGGELVAATDAQVEIALSERKKGRTQQQAAAKANLRSRKTVAKYERAGQLPSALKRPRTYLTRSNPFAQDWAVVEAKLTTLPELEAKALFAWLCREHPGRYQEGQLRSFQRHVKRWRARHVDQVVSLPQRRRPGELMQTDGTWMTELEITIGGALFRHLLIHSVLVYSNWEWAYVARSESTQAVMEGVRRAVRELGHVPLAHQTDPSSAATHRLHLGSDEQRQFQADYADLLAELGMEARVTHVASPDENGDIEAANGALKRAVEQELLLRGSRDFANLAAYELFLYSHLRRRNAARSDRLAEELAVMRPVATLPAPVVKQMDVGVSEAGTIRYMHNTYSVPSRLVGERVRVLGREWTLEVWYAGECVERIPRLVGRYRHYIQYRHVIDSLLKKPGGFRDYRYREDLFPRLVFRQAWDNLCRRLAPRRADLAYLRILKLAARTMESDVATVLATLLSEGLAWTDETVKARLAPATAEVPDLAQPEVSLAEYDQLLSQEVADVAA
jgi:hypothetical protein